MKASPCGGPTAPAEDSGVGSTTKRRKVTSDASAMRSEELESAEMHVREVTGRFHGKRNVHGFSFAFYEAPPHSVRASLTTEDVQTCPWFICHDV